MTPNYLSYDPDRYAEPITDYEYDVPADGSPVARCPYCDRPFGNDRAATLHVAGAHPERCSEDEREAYEAELEDEERDLFTFHLKAAVSVFLIYFLFTFFYALAWVGRF